MSDRAGERGEIINSVGIDIGTSTTQLIFSCITVENRAGSYMAPRVDIVDKQVVYRSDIYCTPLLSPTEIDADAIKDIVEGEYKKAGMTPADVDSGAVIITGETARKQNANTVLQALSDSAGDFVVATAGPDLESVLSARGAGTDKLSEERRCVIANLDVGGGTTNIAVYEKGRLLGVTCLDIGGRLIKVDEGRISYVFYKIKDLAAENGIALEVGMPAELSLLQRVAELMAEIVAQSIGLAPKGPSLRKIYTNDGKGLASVPKPAAVTFSGGVADCIYNAVADEEIFMYGDIGVLLGRAISNSTSFKAVEFVTPEETIRATVVGAGIHTTEISGSTISFAEGYLPIKNIPILNVAKEDEKNVEGIVSSIRSQIPFHMSDGKLEQIAISFAGRDYSSFEEVQSLADAVIRGAEEVIKSRLPLIIVIEKDIGKALGHALNFKLRNAKPVICIDGIKTLNGDYIDIGEPVCNGHVLPVVVKTLIFNS